ncbi:MAG TPA: molybdopterin-dependent oxidoreductase, partial [Anaerolineae bacterium]
ALADVVLPAQSWAEREGTFTSGERRVQRYYPAIQSVGQSLPDWQILAQIAERVGLGKPAFAAGLAFREIAKTVPQYKDMDYRALARVEEQWPDVGGDDLYYGGTAYDNRSGLGLQWPVAAETEAVEQFDVPTLPAEEREGVQLVRTAALYTPGTLINHTELLEPRLARPTVFLHPGDAQTLQVADGDIVTVRANDGLPSPMAVRARAHVNGVVPAGLALLRGVPYRPGTMTAEITVDPEKVVV